MNRNCETCIKRKTIYCPNSADCFATDEKPHYQHKIMLLEENEDLKRQLEEKDTLVKQCEISVINVMDCYCERTDCASRIKNSKKYDSLEQKIEKEQQEFINYLEIEKDRLAEEISGTYENDLGKIKLVNEDIFNEIDKILNKYKEIIGGNKDE